MILGHLAEQLTLHDSATRFQLGLTANNWDEAFAMLAKKWLHEWKSE
jgi:hypothetical protein